MLPWVVLHFNRRIGARERRQLIPHVRFSGSISGAGKLIEIRLRMCGPPLFQLYMLVASLNAVSFFVCCTGRPLLLILRFCGLIFGTARRSIKWDRESTFLLFFY